MHSSHYECPFHLPNKCGSKGRRFNKVGILGLVEESSCQEGAQRPRTACQILISELHMDQLCDSCEQGVLRAEDQVGYELVRP